MSAETEDFIEYVGTSYNSQTPPVDPPVGGQWQRNGCQSQCVSTISQEDADQCAARQQLNCNDDTWIDPNGHDYVNTCNSFQRCISFCPDGLPFSFDVPAFTFCATSQAEANNIAAAYACQQAALRKICISNLTPTEVCVGTAYNHSIVASGGLSSQFPGTWTKVSGNLPDGLTFTASGTRLNITGTPNASGTFNFSFRYRINATGDFMQKSFTMCIVDIDQSSLPDATIGVAYTTTLTVPNCTTVGSGVSWQVISGHLPPGLSIAEQTGVISGVPSGPTAGYLFKVRFQNAAS